MKKIKYKIEGYSEVFNPETQELERVASFATVTVPYSDTALEQAKKEAYNGEYTIEDDGTVEEPSQLDTIEAQVTYTAMMTDTLLVEV